MRCDEVVRELSAPAANRDRAALAGHLAGCPSCAVWARHAEGVDRLWEATRPAEPSPAAWDAVWAQIAATLPGPVAVHRDREDGPALDPSASRNGTGPRFLVHPAPEPDPAGPRRRGRPWRLAAVALVGLAQAAAILVALGLAWRPIERPDAPPAGGPHVAGDPRPIRWESAVTVDVDVPEGRLVVIHADKTEDATPRDQNSSADIGLLILNVMESADSPQVAAR